MSATRDEAEVEIDGKRCTLRKGQIVAASVTLRSIKTLETINSLPVAEFWKRVEAGESPQAK
ncbi:MAG: hypothetical protein NTY01_24055 [Verrucomicrobia bacterium]|nr:hypothetical protein [Verrucomicrobiota bacterium]